MISSLISYVGLPFIVYKILDRLIRIPRVGNYSDRYILVTGCDTGFGNLTAKRLDQLGCHVFAGCLTEKGETELKKVCSERLHAIPLDVTRKESVRNALDYVKEKLPEERGLWGLVNNAGAMTYNGAPDWFTVDSYRRQCDVNLFGLIDVTLTFLPLVKKEKGRVVNMSSVAGRFALTMVTPYSVSKYGVESFTDGLRRSMYVFGCKAILIEPGSYKTRMASRDEFLKLCSTSWNNAPPEIREEYGEEFASYVAHRQIEQFLQHGSDRLSEVVDAYENALFSRYPRVRYVVGKDAKYLFVPLQALPEWLGDWILRMTESGRPLPTALKKT